MISGHPLTWIDLASSTQLNTATLKPEEGWCRIGLHNRGFLAVASYLCDKPLNQWAHSPCRGVSLGTAPFWTPSSSSLGLRLDFSIQGLITQDTSVGGPVRFYLKELDLVYRHSSCCGSVHNRKMNTWNREEWLLTKPPVVSLKIWVFKHLVFNINDQSHYQCWSGHINLKKDSETGKPWAQASSISSLRVGASHLPHGNKPIDVMSRSLSPE